MQNRAAIYCRLSLDKTGAGLAVARQEKECRELADKKGLTVVGVYPDNDKSAYSGKPREQYERLMEDIRAGLIDAVITWHPDRLTRRTAELEEYISATMAIPTYTVMAGHLDLATPAGRATAKTIGAWAQYEVEQKSERQKSKNRQMAASGARPGGGRIPWGYNPDRLTVHPVRGPMIQDACNEVLAGASLASIIRTWNASGERAPRGGRWSYASVRGVLARPLNAGYVFYDGAVLPGVVGEWDPLVSHEIHHAVQALLNHPSRRTTGERGGHNVKHLLSGIARCGSCDVPMKSGSIKQSRGRLKGKNYPLYRCMNPECEAKVSIGRVAANSWVEAEFLMERGGAFGWVETVESGIDGSALAEAEARITGTLAQLGADDADETALLARLTELKAERKALTDVPVTRAVTSHGETAAYRWGEAASAGEAGDIPALRALLREHLGPDGIRILRATKHNGRTVDTGRIVIDWIDPDEGLQFSIE